MKILEQIHRMVWGPWTLGIFLGTGLFLSVKCRFFQIRGLPYWWRRTAGSLVSGTEQGRAASSRRSSMTQFQSVCTALAATVGTGNIAGVATALTAGGPGALFWMWVSAFIGMITAYSETVLGIGCRYRDGNGKYVCGPFVYMERLLGVKEMALLYSFLCLLCAMGMGSMVQANSAVETLYFTWRVPMPVGGLLFTMLVFAVIAGGASRIGNAAEKLIPAASAVYIFFSLLVICCRLDHLPGALAAMLSSAFRPEPAAGGILGYGISRSLRYGISRGVFSNEAGLGTLAVLHGAAEDTTPHEQGMWAMFEVFFDTIVLCTMTAVVILCTAGPELSETSRQGAALASWCFGSCLGMPGEYLVSGSMVVFAFATVIAWFYLGKQAAQYMTGDSRVFCVCIYPALFLISVFWGSQARLALVWLLSDIWNGLMAFPNLTALLFLADQVTLPDVWEK